MTACHITIKNRFKHLSPRVLVPVFFLLTCAMMSTQAQTKDYQSLLKEYGLVDVHSVDSTIIVRLMYSGTDNFMKKDVYGDLEEAYLTPAFAEKMKNAQALLHKEKGTRYSLIIYDAARPHSIQIAMWNVVKGTPNARYVASPGRKSGRHTYGVAVDLSIYDRVLNKPVNMGSAVDHFGIAAHTKDEKRLVAQGIISQEAYDNRQYLYRLMRRVGLKPIPREWWHFQAFESIDKVRRRERLLDF